MELSSAQTSGLSDSILSDIDKIQSIPIIPLVLEVICRSTSMGFTAIARVTKDQWVACAVLDNISFGLKPGGQLEVKSTICDEIRDSGIAVVIDKVASDINYCSHPTPKQYGFQSYISVPIIRKDGTFFGTLCAIDPEPAHLNNVKTKGMFELFAELIAFHLESQDLMSRSQQEIAQSRQELGRYEKLAFHSLREPLRKISLFSEQLMEISGDSNEKARICASKVRSCAIDLDRLISTLISPTK